MDPVTKLERTLKEHRFVLIRQSTHRVFRNPEGRTFVCASTPSDTFRWAKNALAELKRVIESQPKPEVVAVSEYQREQAARVISGESKPNQQGIQGAGRGKKSRGTGFIYEDRGLPPTPEELAEREAVKQRAIDNKEQRRAAKLSRKAELEAARKEREAQKQALEEEKAPQQYFPSNTPTCRK